MSEDAGKAHIPMEEIRDIPIPSDDSYYIRVDEEGYGKVYYIFSEFLEKMEITG